jgi:hypothetical protein
MEDQAKLNKLKILLDISVSDTSKDDLLNVLLDDAGEEIINRVFPYNRNGITYQVPEKYYNKQIKIALWMFNKIGAEGQKSHYENGIKREWESSNLPNGLISDIVPFVGAIEKSSNVFV